jgi:tetraacyldisaccharide-1-P 4'-kinase
MLPGSFTIFPDHYRYKANDLASIVKKAVTAGAKSLITTAKDAVKLGDFSSQLACYVLQIEVKIEDESRFLEMIHSTVSHYHR